MKKHLLKLIPLLAIPIAFGVSLLYPSDAQALAGLCANCHVMHASQTGTASTANDYLLNATCLGCHTGTNTGSDAFVMTTGLAAGTDIATDLAGGNFGWADAGDRLGHNPVELAGGVDATLTSPPGWKATGFAVNGQVGATWGSNDLTCAGTYGCHGTHDATGVTGAHHSNSNGSLAIAGTVGTSYRFLNGIKGYEDNDYEFETATDHNVYYGEARSGAESSGDRVSDTATISYFCAECHGIFHSGVGNEGISDTSDTLFSNPWIRHPVDVSMPNSGEYAGYNAYVPAVPTASSDVTDGTITIGNASDRIVMCLSCHRADASPWGAALRWDPSAVVSGAGASTTGCFACHTTKDT